MARKKGEVPFDVTGMELPKSSWRGHPLRKVERFILVDDGGGKRFYVGLLECGHGVIKPPSVMSFRKHGTLACFACEKVEKKLVPSKSQPEPSPQADALARTIEQQSQLMMNMGKMLQQMNDRLAQVEEVATRPVSSTNTPDPDTSPES